MGDEWQGAHFHGSRHVAPGFLTRFRSDRSFPAFSDTDLRPGTPAREPDPGNGDPADGDPWGTWGGYLEWDPESVQDTADHWSVAVWVVHRSPYPNDIPESDAILASVTPRRLQGFDPRPGEFLRWSLTRVSNGQTLDEGSVQAGPDGVVTVPGVILLAEETTLRIWREAVVRSDLLRDDSIGSLHPWEDDLSLILPLAHPEDRYLVSIRSGDEDPDPVVADPSRPLVFYGLASDTLSLRLSRSGAHIRFFF